MDRSLLNKATSQDDSPTPGYLIGEIARMTFASPDAPEKLLSFLLKRLARDNASVKLKTLRLVKHVCEKGRPDFQKLAQRQSDPIKRCLQYRGPPDPLRGDEPSKLVREEAAQTLKALFATPPAICAEQSKSRITGFGGASEDSGDQSAPPGIPCAPPREFQQSSPLSPTNKGDGLLTTVGNMMSRVLPGGAFGQANSHGPSMGSVGSVAPKWAAGGHQRQAQEASEPNATFRPPTLADRDSTKTVKPSSGSVMSHEYEKLLISNIVAPGGAKVDPPREVLQEFCAKCVSLQPSVVATLLMNHLKDESQSWQSRCKAMCCIEALAGLDKANAIVGASNDNGSTSESISEIYFMAFSSLGAPRALEDLMVQQHFSERAHRLVAMFHQRHTLASGTRVEGSHDVNLLDEEARVALRPETVDLLAGDAEEPASAARQQHRCDGEPNLLELLEDSRPQQSDRDLLGFRHVSLSGTDGVDLFGGIYCQSREAQPRILESASAATTDNDLFDGMVLTQTSPTGAHTSAHGDPLQKRDVSSSPPSTSGGHPGFLAAREADLLGIDTLTSHETPGVHPKNRDSSTCLSSSNDLFDILH